MFNLNDYIQKNRKGFMVKPVRCKSGLSMSVQASSGHYCSPREDFGPWASVEVGFPSEPIEDLMEYITDNGEPTETVYSWVPVEVVEKIVNENGGLAGD